MPTDMQTNKGLRTSGPFVFQVKDTTGQVVQIPDTHFVLSGDTDTLSAAQTYSDTVVTNYLETLVPDWVYPPITEPCIEYYNGHAWALVASRDYADRAAASAFASAKILADAALNRAKTDLQTYSDNKLVEAKVYAATQDGIILTSAKAYADSLGKITPQERIFSFFWKYNSDSSALFRKDSENRYFMDDLSYEGGDPDAPAYGSIFSRYYDLFDGQYQLMHQLVPFLEWSALTRDWNYYGGGIKNLKDPALPGDAVTKRYVDNTFGKVRSIKAGTGLRVLETSETTDTITSSGTLALSPSGVIPGTYTYPTVTYDVSGRATSVTNGTAPDVNRTYVDAQDQLTLVHSKDYTDGKTWTTAQITNFSSAIQSYNFATQSWVTGTALASYATRYYADSQDGATLAAARAYTDSKNGTVTSITAGDGLTGGTITTSGIIALNKTGVVAGSFTNANITVGEDGRITTASNGSGGGGGGNISPVRTISTHTVLTNNDSVILVDSFVQPVTVTLPVQPVQGLNFTIKDKTGLAHVNPIVIVGASSLETVSFTAPADLSMTSDGSHAFMIRVGGSGAINIAKNASSDTIKLMNYTWGITGVTKVVVSPDDASLWCLSTDNGSVTIAGDPTLPSPPIKAQLALGNGPNQVVFAGNYAYVAHLAGNNVSVIQNVTGTPSVHKTIPVGNIPFFVASTPDKSKVYSVNTADDSLTVIQDANTAQSSVLKTLHNVGNKPFGMKFSADGSHGYVYSAFSKTIAVIGNASSDPFIKTNFDVEKIVFEIFISGDYGFITHSETTRFTVVKGIMTGNLSVQSTLPLSYRGYKTVVDPVQGLAWITHRENNKITVVSKIMTLQPVIDKIIDLPGSPTDMIFTPNQKRVYVTYATQCSMTNLTMSREEITTSGGSKRMIFDGIKWFAI